MTFHLVDVLFYILPRYVNTKTVFSHFYSRILSGREWNISVSVFGSVIYITAILALNMWSKLSGQYSMEQTPS